MPAFAGMTQVARAMMQVTRAMTQVARSVHQSLERLVSPGAGRGQNRRRNDDARR